MLGHLGHFRRHVGVGEGGFGGEVAVGGDLRPGLGALQGVFLERAQIGPQVGDFVNCGVNEFGGVLCPFHVREVNVGEAFKAAEVVHALAERVGPHIREAELFVVAPLVAQLEMHGLLGEVQVALNLGIVSTADQFFGALPEFFEAHLVALFVQHGHLHDSGHEVVGDRRSLRRGSRAGGQHLAFAVGAASADGALDVLTRIGHGRRVGLVGEQSGSRGVHIEADVIPVFLMLHHQPSVIQDFRLQRKPVVPQRLVEVGDEDFLKVAVCGFSGVEFGVFLVVLGDFADGFAKVALARVEAGTAVVVGDEQRDRFAQQVHRDRGGAEHLGGFRQGLDVHFKAFGRRGRGVGLGFDKAQALAHHGAPVPPAAIEQGGVGTVVGRVLRNLIERSQQVLHFHLVGLAHQLIVDGLVGGMHRQLLHLVEQLGDFAQPAFCGLHQIDLGLDVLGRLRLPELAVLEGFSANQHRWPVTAPVQHSPGAEPLDRVLHPLMTLGGVAQRVQRGEVISYSHSSNEKTLWGPIPTVSLSAGASLSLTFLKFF